MAFVERIKGAGLCACELCRHLAPRRGNRVLWGWDELSRSLINDIGALSKVEMANGVGAA